jgi:beta-1,4-mannosyl-glycoprotein beta-1,4-N-acetylglucosaminyltransferase
MAVYDAFMFFNEFDLLSVRLAEHDPFVDYFVLVQADRTHSGEIKPLHFSKTDPRFAQYVHKMFVVNVPLQEKPESAWVNESLQRQAVFTAVEYDPQDIVYLSDVDEIISRHHWRYLLNRMKREKLIGVWLKMYYYFLNLELIDHPWAMAKIMKAKVFLESKVSGNEIRCSPAAITTPFPCGWHFSYLMTVEQIIQKISAYGHQENNKAEFKDPKNIEQAMKGRKDLFGRDMVFKTVRFNQNWPKGMCESKKWQSFVIKTDAKVWACELFGKAQNSVKELAKTVLEPVLKAWLGRGNKKDSFSSFGSETFQNLILARPKNQSPQEWRRLVEFLDCVLPRMEDGYPADKCAELFIKLVSSLSPHSKIVAVGNSKGRSLVLASRAATGSDSTVFFAEPPLKKLPPDGLLELKKNISLYAADNVKFCGLDDLQTASQGGLGSIDFLIIEPSLKAKLSQDDIESFKSLLKPNGVLWAPEIKGGSCAESDLLLSRNY